METIKLEETFRAIEAIENANKWEVEEKYQNSDSYSYTEFCACCGRGIKGEPKFYIHAIAPYLIVPFDTDSEEVEAKGVEDMGCYPIGSECKKRYPAGYVGTI